MGTGRPSRAASSPATAPPRPSSLTRPASKSTPGPAAPNRGGSQLFPDGGDGASARVSCHISHRTAAGPNFSHSACSHFCATQDEKFQRPYPAQLFPFCELSLLRHAEREIHPAAPSRGGTVCPVPLVPVSGTFSTFRRFLASFQAFRSARCLLVCFWRHHTPWVPFRASFSSPLPAPLSVPIPPMGREEPKKPNLKALRATKLRVGRLEGGCPYRFVKALGGSF